jgi:hypothetical protein
LRGVEIDGVGQKPSPIPIQRTGVTAEIAEARTKLRETAPKGTWDAVLSEVRRLQLDERMSPLAALQTVQGKLAAGWVPPGAR